MRGTVYLRRGLVVLAAIACLAASAPAWASAATGDTAATVRHFAPIRLTQAQLRMSLGSLALTNSDGATRQAGLTMPATGARPRAHLSLTPGTLTYRGGRVRFSISAPHATRCWLSSSPRIFSGPNPQRVRCRQSETLTLPAVATPMHWTFRFTARNARGQVAVAKRTLWLQAPPFPVSTNWSGYVTSSDSLVTETSGRFVVPTLNCARTPNAGMSTWAGIGGAGQGTGDLLQTGVRSDCTGGVQYNGAAWWELVPPLPEQDFNSMSISPGDTMQASVWQNSDGSWTTRLDDLSTGVSGLMTTGRSYGTILDSNPTIWLDREGSAAGVAYSGGYTAEWIVEDYESAGANVPFADFGTVSFSDLTTSASSWGGLTGGDELGVEDPNGFLLAAPSSPDSSGHGFSVNYTG